MTPLETPEAMAERVYAGTRFHSLVAAGAARSDCAVGIRADREAIASRLTAAIENPDPFPALRALLAEIGGSK